MQNNNKTKKFIEENQGKYFCHCGCNKEIIIKRNYQWRGIPQYIKGHQFFGENNPMFNKIPWNKKLTKETDIRVKKYCENNSGFFKIGHVSPNKNKKISQETKDKISKSTMGRISWNKNKKSSQETCEKISKSRKGKYCGENNPNWKGGKSFKPYCEKWTNKIREEIRNQYDRKCYICNKLESEQIKKQKENGKRGFRLSVHHIDLDKEQGCNGKAWKLVPLCLICHVKLHNKKIKVL